MINRLRSDEQGLAMVIALALITLITTIALTMYVVTSGDQSRSRRDSKATGAYQAAEAGTNAYLSNLTESMAFFNAYMAKGEAARWDSSNVKHNSSTTSDAPWTWGSTWTYKTAPAADTNWYDVGNGYEYLTMVYPPNGALTQTTAQAITRIDVIGRPKGSADTSTWRNLETMIRPTALTDFQAFLGTSVTYASTATTTGPIFVGQNSAGVAGNLTHNGTALANLYAQGTVGGTTTYGTGVKKYDKNTTPTALCKLNNCNPIPFSSFQSTITTVSGAASAGGITLAATDPTNAGLSGQSYNVDAWKLVFQSSGNVLVSSCKLWYGTLSRNGSNVTKSWPDYDTVNPPVCGTATTRPVPSNGAIYSAKDVLVSGVVKGKVTIATSADVIFGGNTTYNTNGADVLGLEAQGTVYVAQWSVSGANPTLNLWAAILSLNGPFRSDPDYDPSPDGTMNYHGSSAVYGDPAGAVIFTNQFDFRNYLYDNNLRFVQPPYWPTLGNAFVILAQREI